MIIIFSQNFTSSNRYSNINLIKNPTYCTQEEHELDEHVVRNPQYGETPTTEANSTYEDIDKFSQVNKNSEPSENRQSTHSHAYLQIISGTCSKGASVGDGRNRKVQTPTGEYEIMLPGEARNEAPAEKTTGNTTTSSKSKEDDEHYALIP